jgi:hypothetical protein
VNNKDDCLKLHHVGYLTNNAGLNQAHMLPIRCLGCEADLC